MKNASLAILTCVLLAPFGTIAAQDLAAIVENCDGCQFDVSNQEFLVWLKDYAERMMK